MTSVQLFLEGPLHNICEDEKIVQNLSRFLTTLDFNREYLRKGATYRKSVKLLIIYLDPLPRWTKKRWYTLVNKRKS